MAESHRAEHKAAQLAGRLGNIAPFHVMELVKKAAALEQQGRHIIHMGIGEPDFTAPAPVVAAATRAMSDGRLQYTNSTGIPALREAISAHYRRVYGLDIPASRIVVTAGASAALLLACATLVDPGTEVLMPDPSYPCNRHFVAAFDGIDPFHVRESPAHSVERSFVDQWADQSAGIARIANADARKQLANAGDKALRD